MGEVLDSAKGVLKFWAAVAMCVVGIILATKSKPVALADWLTGGLIIGFRMKADFEEYMEKGSLFSVFNLVLKLVFLIILALAFAWVFSVY